MGRPISTEYVQARRILTGVVDPSGLGLVFELDGNRVYARGEANERVTGRSKVIPAGASQSIVDDAAHATVAALKKRVGVTRESRVRFLKPLYSGEPFRADGTIFRDTADLFVVQVRVVNKREQLCIEAEVEVFALTAEQVRRMTPDGMVPAELKRYLP
jgi:acyl-coenzyme A thioesterase PaaI-like protein